MDGGNLDLVMQTGGETNTGAATVTNFGLRDEPAFRRLMASAPASAPGQTVDPLEARFQKLTIAFDRSPGALQIRDAVIYNPYMGLTTEGAVDFARNRVDVTGTFIPAYSVNSLLGKIPLVGVLLGGGEGVFAISYRAKGALGRAQSDHQSAVGDRSGNPAQDSGRGGRDRRAGPGAGRGRGGVAGELGSLGGALKNGFPAPGETAASVMSLRSFPKLNGPAGLARGRPRQQ